MKDGELREGLRSIALGMVVSAIIAFFGWSADLRGSPGSIQICRDLCAPRAVHAFVGVTARCECESRP